MAGGDSSSALSEEERFMFDLKGWLLLPGVLEDSLLEAIRAHLLRVADERRQIGPLASRYSLTGPAQELLDHPEVVRVLRGLIGPDVGPDAYGFRCESSFFVRRQAGQSGFQAPHAGASPGPLGYSVQHGVIVPGLTRVVWELTDVQQASGGTAILSGSHKASFPVPERLRRYDSGLYEGYQCPAGSLLVFSEQCWHYGVEWRDVTRDRLAVFNCYNSYLSQWHRLNLPAGVVKTMPTKRRSLFRGVWGRDVQNARANDYFDFDNHSL
jgi:hypothetical protein